MTTTHRLEAAPAQVRTAPRFPVLDTLRAVGAIAVVTTHSSFQTGDYVGHGVWSTLLSRLDVGVAIFFVLSGFLLTRPHLARAATGRAHPPVTRYYAKRALRIYPVYLVAVVVALVLVDQDARVGIAEWVRSLLLIDVYTQPALPQGLTQMWSLAAEVAFYVVLPPLLALGVGHTLRPRRVWLLLAALVALSVAWHVGLARAVDDVSPGVPLSWLPGYLTWFAVGIALALLHVEAEARGASYALVQWARALGAMPGACWGAAGALLLVAATPLAGPSLLFVATPAQSLFKHLDYALIAGLVVLPGVFGPPDGRYARVMSLPLLRHLGHISYSTFCIHLAVLHAVMSLTGTPLFSGRGWTIWTVTVLASLAASEALYRTVELPALRLKDRTSGKRTAASTR